MGTDQSRSLCSLRALIIFKREIELRYIATVMLSEAMSSKAI